MTFASDDLMLLAFPLLPKRRIPHTNRHPLALAPSCLIRSVSVDRLIDADADVWI